MEAARAVTEQVAMEAARAVTEQVATYTTKQGKEWGRKQALNESIDRSGVSLSAVEQKREQQATKKTAYNTVIEHAAKDTIKPVKECGIEQASTSSVGTNDSLNKSGEGLQGREPTHVEHSAKDVTSQPPDHSLTTPCREKNQPIKSHQQVTSVEHLKQSPQPNDVLLGRGAIINDHEGNKRFRKLIKKRKRHYLFDAARSQKAEMARDILNKIHTLGGRFLKRVPTTPTGDNSQSCYTWQEVDDSQALEKCMQAFRNKTSPPQVQSRFLNRVQTIPTGYNYQGCFTWQEVDGSQALEKCMQAFRNKTSPPQVQSAKKHVLEQKREEQATKKTAYNTVREQAAKDTNKQGNECNREFANTNDSLKESIDRLDHAADGMDDGDGLQGEGQQTHVSHSAKDVTSQPPDHSLTTPHCGKNQPIKSHQQVTSVEHLEQPPQPNDVLLGRGANINNHEGNIQYRRFVRKKKRHYLSDGARAQKADMARDILNKIHALGGRFLKRVPTTPTEYNSQSCYTWQEVDDSQALEKCMQSLREKQGMTHSQLEAAKKNTCERREQEPTMTLYNRNNKSSMENESLIRLIRPDECASGCAESETRVTNGKPEEVEHYANDASQVASPSCALKEDEDRALIEAYSRAIQVQPMAPPATHAQGFYGQSNTVEGSPELFQVHPMTCPPWQVPPRTANIFPHKDSNVTKASLTPPSHQEHVQGQPSGPPNHRAVNHPRHASQPCGQSLAHSGPRPPVALLCPPNPQPVNQSRGPYGNATVADEAWEQILSLRPDNALEFASRFGFKSRFKSR